MTHAVKFGE